MAGDYQVCVSCAHREMFLILQLISVECWLQ